MFPLCNGHRLKGVNAGLSLEIETFMHPQIQGDAHEVLESLLRYLEKEYYTRIDGLCDRAELNVAELESLSVPEVASLYTSISKKLVGQVRQYIRLRRHALLPYIQELLEKEETGHDCRSCSSSCSIRHTAQLIDIKEAHTKIKETLYRLQTVSIAISGTSDTDSIYRSLKTGIMQLDTALTESFYLEETSLIPKIMEAQKAIHAHN